MDTPSLRRSSAVDTRSVTHRIRNPRTQRKGVLIITGYDYFLHKGDFRRLLRQYGEIILIPRAVDSDYLINQAVRPLMRKHSRIHLVTNPQYDQQHHVVYELVVRQSKSLRVSTVNDFCEKHLRKLYVPDAIEEGDLIAASIPSFGPGTLRFKKVLDLVASTVLLLLSMPLWALSAWRIRVESPGPVFYRQPRLGRDEVPFDCLKFRSMRLDAEAGGAAFSSRTDKRVFPYGAMMRAARIDELPQLLNVLRGEISLIGPRPERPVFTESFVEYIPHYASRHAVKPGITGYAQIRYSYGAGLRDARHKLMYDLYYIKNWSVALELRVLLETIVIVLGKKGW